MKTPQKNHRRHPLDFWSGTLTGLLAGVMLLTSSVSYAALIFSGPLERHLAAGLGIALVSAVVIAVIVALGSSFRFASAGPDSTSSALYALMAAAVVAEFKAPTADAHLLPTVWAVIILGALLLGLLLFVVGKLRLGRWFRFVPYPVVCGFLAATGWMVISGAFRMMTGNDLGWGQIEQLLQPSALTLWLPGMAFSLLLLLVLRRFRHYLLMPAMLVAGIAAAHVLIALTGTSLADARSQNWLLAPIASGHMWRVMDFSLLPHADWGIITGQGGNMAAMLTVVLLAIVLQTTGVELAVGADADLDRELTVSGIANLAAGLCGGMIGHISISRSLLVHRAGARNAVAGITAGIVCLAVFFFGGSFFGYLPKAVLGGFLLFFGLSLFIDWVVRPWFVLPKGDYLIVLLIMVVVVNVGFMAGLGVGICAAAGLFIFSYSRIDAVKHVLSGSTGQSNVARSGGEARFLRENGNQIYILRLHNYLFFGTAYALITKIRQRVAAAGHPPVRFVILDFHLVSGLDSSAAYYFLKLKQIAETHRLQLVFTDLEHCAQLILKQIENGDATGKQLSVLPDLDRGIQWCEDQILRAMPAEKPLSGLLAEQLQHVFGENGQIELFRGYLKRCALSAGRALFRQGDQSDGMYFLEAGQVSVLYQREGRSMLRLRTFAHGTILGEMGLYAAKPRSATVAADTDSTLFFLSNKALQRMEKENPALAIGLHKHIIGMQSSRLQHTERQMRRLLD